MEQEVFTVVGYQFGSFESKNGDTVPYNNLFVLQDMTGEESDKYHFCGSKALKKPCVDASVFDKINIGDKVNLYFDIKGRVTFARPVSAK